MTERKLYDAEGRELNCDHYFTPEGYTRSTYETHYYNVPDRKREAGTLIRICPPFFSCEFIEGVNGDALDGQPTVYDVKQGMHFYGMRVKDEADFPTKEHKNYAMLHAAAWHDFSNKIDPTAQEMKVLRRYERIITGQEELPTKPKENPESIPF